MTTPFRSSPRPGPTRMRRPLSPGPTPCHRVRVATTLCRRVVHLGKQGSAAKPPTSSRDLPRRVRMRDQATGNIARQWAQNDPTAALAWTQDAPGGEGQSRAMQSVLSSWAQSDPTGAADYVAALPARQDAGGRGAINRATTRHRRCANRLELGAKTSRRTNASKRSQSDRRAMERDGSGQCR